MGQVQGGWRLTSLAQEVTPAPAPWTFMDVLQSWGNTWLWENISMAGGYNWLHEAITDGSLIAVTDGSYIRELYPNLCSAACVLECKKGQECLIGLGVITGGERILRGAAWPDGRPPHLTECRQDSQEPGGKCGVGL